MALPLDGYVRVSRVGERSGESFTAPGVQEQAIRDWASRNGREVLMGAARTQRLGRDHGLTGPPPGHGGDS